MFAWVCSQARWKLTNRKILNIDNTSKAHGWHVTSIAQEMVKGSPKLFSLYKS